MPKKRICDYHMKKDGWKFFQLLSTPGVLVAERRLNQTEDPALLKTDLKKRGFRVFFEHYGHKKGTIMELYKRYEYLCFAEQVEQFLKELS